MNRQFKITSSNVSTISSLEQKTAHFDVTHGLTEAPKRVGTRGNMSTLIDAEPLNRLFHYEVTKEGPRGYK